MPPKRLKSRGFTGLASLANLRDFLSWLYKMRDWNFARKSIRLVPAEIVMAHVEEGVKEMVFHYKRALLGPDLCPKGPDKVYLIQVLKGVCCATISRKNVESQKL